MPFDAEAYDTRLAPTWERFIVTPPVTTLNVERLNQLADFIENNVRDGQFNLAIWERYSFVDSSCRLVRERRILGFIGKPKLRLQSSFCGCVAGIARALFGTPKPATTPQYEAQELLGLSSKQASDLFMGWRNGQSKDRSNAAQVIRHLALTGYVCW